MLVVGAIVLILGLAYAYAVLHIGLMQAHPWAIDAGVLAACVLAWVGVVRTRRRVAGVLGALFVSALAGLYGAATYVIPEYGADRPRGVATGDTFPRIELEDALRGVRMQAGAVPAGMRATFLVFFRGFW